MTKRIAILASASLLLSGALSLSAAELVRYDFSGGLAPTTSASSITASPIGFGAFNENRNPSDRGHSKASQGNLFARVKSTGEGLPLLLVPTAEDALAAETFFTITLKANGTDAVPLGQFSAKVGAQKIGTPTLADYTIHCFLRSSADNFQADLGKFSYLKQSTSGGTTYAENPWTVDLTKLSVPAGSPITFRLYVYVETDTPNFGQSIRLDDISITSK
ncbi:hypothetical protein [Geminisphaera colitermitum]|uniref:hypothetical protein n=1 Tax=Geminisphaera colitermitum TaxID=1148786 RepID=UPI0005B845E7|nr:hypothetical protein [Geminisphaera colitermitum]